MKKILVFLLMSLAVCAVAVAQNGVCGIPYGTSKYEARKILKERFGYDAVHDEYGSLRVDDGSVGGIEYDYMEFKFAWIDGKSKFNGAYFQALFSLSEKNVAIEKRNYVHNKYNSKYDSNSFNSEDGFKCYRYFGPDKELVAVLILDTDTGGDGKRRYCVEVYHFGPYDYTDDI